MNPPPLGWPRLSASVYYDDPRTAIDWLCRAFGFEVRLLVEGEGGRVEHSELTMGGAMIMVGGTGIRDEGKAPWQAYMRSPKSINGYNTQALMLYIDDVDAHCAQARVHGAVVYRDPKDDDYGEDYWADRAYGAKDPEGHHWWFVQRLRSGKTDGQS